MLHRFNHKWKFCLSSSQQQKQIQFNFICMINGSFSIQIQIQSLLMISLSTVWNGTPFIHHQRHFKMTPVYLVMIGHFQKFLYKWPTFSNWLICLKMFWVFNFKIRIAQLAVLAHKTSIRIDFEWAKSTPKWASIVLKICNISLTTKWLYVLFECRSKMK